MIEERGFGFSREVVLTSPVSCVTVMEVIVLLLVLLQNEPVLADGCPMASFSEPRTFAAGPGCCVSVAVGDFNGDGKADLVVGNSSLFDGSVFHVSILLGNGDGTFQAAVNYYAGANPLFVAVADFNGDGKPDLATANESYSRNVSVIFNKGDGTFQTAVNYDAGSFPVSIAVGDFNGDGKLDLASANYDSFDQSSNTFTNGNVSVLLGNEDGTFQAAVGYSAGFYPSSVSAGDFNGDGKSDLAVANSGSDNVSVLFGKGDGTFQNAVNISAGRIPKFIAVGDFNGDGKQDLAVANYGSVPDFPDSSVSVLLGNGDGTFRNAVNYNGGSAPVSLATADFNGDGNPDLAVADFYSTNVSVLLGNGDGTFQTAVNFNRGGYAGSSEESVAVGDFNGDGKPDLAVAVCNGVSVLLNTCASAGVHLDVTRSNTNLMLSWPLLRTNFVLESATNLTSTNWQIVSKEITTNNGRCEVRTTLEQGPRYFRLNKPGSGTGAFPQSAGNPNNDRAPDPALSNGYFTAVLRSECTSAPSPPPPVGQVASGTDYVIMTVAKGDALDYRAAQRVVTDAIFESLMPRYCALPRGTGVGCVTNRVQWNIIAYDADGNPKVSGCAASGCDFHYFDQKSVTPRERIESLLTWVKTDMAAGILNQGNGKRLTAKLNAALGNLASANTQRAIKELKAFLDEVDAIVKSGRFSKAAAQPLIDEAVEIIADVGG